MTAPAPPVAGRRTARVPFRTAPMLATLVPAPVREPGWIHEEKYDGIRILAYKEGGAVELRTRNGIDRAAGFPAIAAAVAKLPAPALLLDGEIVAVDAGGVSRFQLLQRGGRPRFAVFDCLYVPGRDLRREPLHVRRAELAAVVPRGAVVHLARRLARDGLRAYHIARERGLEGVVAKRVDSIYEPIRSPHWRKVKVRREEEFVVGGYTRPAGSRLHLGALLLGAYDRDGRLQYAGKVGTGFDRATLAELARRLRPLVRARASFAVPPRGAGITWVAPRLVAQIAFHEWTSDRKLRQPAFLGLREDKSPTEIHFPEDRS